MCRSVPEIHLHVAGTLSNQQTNIVMIKGYRNKTVVLVPVSQSLYTCQHFVVRCNVMEHSSSSSPAFPARSLGFTILRKISVYVAIF